jgi:hypothetical protein
VETRAEKHALRPILKTFRNKSEISGNRVRINLFKIQRKKKRVVKRSGKQKGLSGRLSVYSQLTPISKKKPRMTRRGFFICLRTAVNRVCKLVKMKCKRVTRSCVRVNLDCERVNRECARVNRPCVWVNCSCVTVTCSCERVTRSCERVTRSCVNSISPCESVNRACKNAFLMWKDNFRQKLSTLHYQLSTINRCFTENQWIIDSG